MTILPRPEIEDLYGCYHGGLHYEEIKGIGIAPEDIIDFSANYNLLGPPVQMKAALENVAIDCYPDSEATELRQCLARKLAVLPENILMGNGSVELIRFIVQAYFSPGDFVLLIEPTFGEYEIASRIAGCHLIKQQLREEEGFKLRTEQMVEMIERYHPKGIFICNPNNPTGQYLTRDELEAILDAGKNSLLTLDEAYISFVDDAWSSLNMIRSGNVIVLRTMTKDYALAGLRLGCAIAEPEVISILRRVRPPWNVNVVAQRAGVIALENDEYLERSKRSFHEAKSFLIGALSGIGLPPFPSQTNFLLVKVGDARRFRLALLRRGIAIRDCSSFGMPQYVRIAVGTLPNCQKLVTVIREIMGKSDDSRLQGKDNSLN